MLRQRPWVSSGRDKKATPSATPAQAPHIYECTQPTATASQAERRRRLDRPGRRRAVGGGDGFDLAAADQFLLALVWPRHHPTQECLGEPFGVSDSTARRAVRRCLPLLGAAGQDGTRRPGPGRGRRRGLPARLSGAPELAVVVDAFEERTRRPRGQKQG
jgi:hypothetical protein